VGGREGGIGREGGREISQAGRRGQGRRQLSYNPINPRGNVIFSIELSRSFEHISYEHLSYEHIGWSFLSPSPLYMMCL
jgi:hypothetical protein